MPETAIKERPILFSGPMVRACLHEIDPKTQTRRVMKPQPAIEERMSRRSMCWRPRHAKLSGIAAADESVGAMPVCNWNPDLPVMDSGAAGIVQFCPYGKVGDRLWVRETWRPEIAHCCCQDACDCDDVVVTYAADGDRRLFSGYEVASGNYWEMPKAAKKGNIPSIFMPRWASRLTLEITDVRVERLQEITEADAIAEGFSACSFRDGRGEESARLGFRRLWEDLNASRGFGWASNPWVWIVSFRRLELANA